MQSDKSSPKEVAICVFCKEIPYSSDCPTCHNIRTYRAQSKERDLQERLSEQVTSSEVRFPGPGVVRRSPIYGNYVVASRRIEAGELICLEKPLLISPYAPSDIIPICLSCYKDVGFSSNCSKCRWPICSPACEEDPIHKENECDILRRNGLRTKHVVTEYFSIEVLRGLLLRENAPEKWKSVLRFESHLENRMNCAKAVETLKFIANFIRNRCNLGADYDEELVNHLTGVLSVNTFWGFKDLKKYSSILFDKVTLFAHDCDPNTNRVLLNLTGDESTGVDANGNLIKWEDEDDCYANANVGIRVEASRTIEPEEMITIQYVDVSVPVKERRQELKDLFYFDCSCSKCLNELLDESSRLLENMSTNESQVINVDDKLAEIQIASICCEN